MVTNLIAAHIQSGARDSKTPGSFTHTVSGILWGFVLKIVACCCGAHSQSQNSWVWKTWGTSEGSDLRSWEARAAQKSFHNLLNVFITRVAVTSGQPLDRRFYSVQFSFEGDPQTWSHHSEFSRLPQKVFNDIINYNI